MTFNNCFRKGKVFLSVDELKSRAVLLRKLYELSHKTNNKNSVKPHVNMGGTESLSTMVKEQNNITTTLGAKHLYDNISHAKREQLLSPKSIFLSRLGLGFDQSSFCFL